MPLGPMETLFWSPFCTHSLLSMGLAVKDGVCIHLISKWQWVTRKGIKGVWKECKGSFFIKSPSVVGVNQRVIFPKDPGASSLVLTNNPDLHKQWANLQKWRGKVSAFSHAKYPAIHIYISNFQPPQGIFFKKKTFNVKVENSLPQCKQRIYFQNAHPPKIFDLLLSYPTANTSFPSLSWQKCIKSYPSDPILGNWFGIHQVTLASWLASLLRPDLSCTFSCLVSFTLPVLLPRYRLVCFWFHLLLVLLCRQVAC